VSAPAVTFYDRLQDVLGQGLPVAVATVVRGDPLGAKLLVLPDGVEGGLGHPALDGAVADTARALLAAERSATQPFAVPGIGAPIEVYVETYPPPPLLLIVGAVHVAQPLCRFAKALGFAVVVADARAKLATPERFPEADEIILKWPDVALGQLAIVPSTSVAILTHDPKFDEPAILGALATPAGYIGAVGSRSTNQDRRRRLAEAGVSAEDLTRVHGPIGLDIGAETPEEMAIAILAEIVAARHGRSGGPLTSASGAIRGDADGAVSHQPSAASTS